jgi:hypothetical protein
LPRTGIEPVYLVGHIAGVVYPTGLIKTNYTISDEKTSSMDATVILLGFGPGYDDWFGFKK